MAKKSNIHEVINALRPKLLDYLETQGIQAKNKEIISCLHPSHEDKHPSCGLNKGNEYYGILFRCFGCGKSGNIFHAAYYLENKPFTGPEFFEDTLPYLCKMFDIPYEPREIGYEERIKYQKYRAYEDAVNITHYNMFKDGKLREDHDAITHLIERGITEESIKKFKIGAIDMFSDYINEMKNVGWSDRNFLNNSDLANNGLFHKDGIIIPIKNHRGKTVAFVTRTTKLQANDKGHKKYNNSISSDIYKKGEILYNFNNFSLDKDGGRLYIVEGYLDAIYLSQCGLNNVVAIGATVLTEEHVKTLYDKKAKDIYLILDADNAGREGVKLAIERLSGYKYFNLKIVDLPDETDPDSYVRERGLDDFRKLCRKDSLSSFAWTLKHSAYTDDPMITAERAIPTIVEEESNITRLRYIKELSNLTGIPEIDIKRDVDSKINKESSQYLDELSDISNYVQVQLSRRNIRDTRSILADASHKVENIDRLFNNKTDNKAEYVDKIQEMRNKISSGEIKYGLMTKKFSAFEEMVEGIPYTCCLTLVGGKPSAGKTTWLTALGVDIVESNEDAAIFYMSIDDSTELMTLKMLAQKTGIPTAEIKRYVELDDVKKAKIDKGWAWLNKLTDRFVLSDASSGNSVEALESSVTWFINNYPNHKRIVLLDNFHKLRSSTSGKQAGRSDKVSDLSERLKSITQLKDTHIMMTVELRKMQDAVSRPTPEDMKDSVQLHYDSDVIVMVHNDQQVKPETNVVYQHSDSGKSMPFLENYVWKNKITGRTGDLAYKLNTINLQITEVSSETTRKLRTQKSQSNVFGNPTKSRFHA